MGSEMCIRDRYESKLELEEEVTNTQMAICEVYEALEAKEGGEV